uniref:LUC7 like 3 pre-mRNA splicing factor n=2 Tax=Sus scrofa TaxID=9823 RepID=A0A4X1THE0_PIG
MILAVQYLDESMSWERNLTPGEKCSNMRWDHQSICKYYLCGFCPVELFTNIHSDLGQRTTVGRFLEENRKRHKVKIDI